MIQVFYSNQIERLLDALAGDVRALRAPRPDDPLRGLFEPVDLVVPNRNLQTYLELGLARTLGVAANLRPRFLNEVVGELCAPPSRDGDPAPLLDAARIEAHLLDLLHDPALLAEPELSAVHGYLEASGGRPEVVDRRRTQLAVRLARLFEEYGLSRPELLGSWPRGLRLAETPYAPAERWQRRLWLEVRRRSGGRLLGEALQARLREARGGRPPGWPDSLFVFGFSYLALAYQQLLAALGGHLELHIYALNPCMEFWEDLVPARQADAGSAAAARFPRRAAVRPAADGEESLEGDDPFGLLAGEDSVALARWGRPGREHIRLLNGLSEFAFRSGFVDPLERTTSLLAQLQHDILVRTPAPRTDDALAGATSLASLQVLACPSLRREVEVIAEQIWRLMQENETEWRAGRAARLRWNDIAVVVNGPDRDAYHAHIGAVFAEAHELPYHVVDSSLLSQSRTVQAARLLLDLPLGGFTRQEVLRVVTHPLVLARYPDADPERWITLCDRLGILHGADHGDHAGTYIELDLYNWDQGLRRLVLGAFMAGERSGAAVVVPLGDHEYLPEELPAGDLEHTGALLLLLRSLIADARTARTARLTLGEWATFIGAMLSTYLVPAHRAEVSELSRCLKVVNRLRDLELAAGGEPRRYGYAVVHELCQERLAALTSGHGQYLADGVVVSSLLPMRALPFRHVFVAGLGEGRFPRPDPADLLDLRRARRRAGDVTPREQDQYLFLETLLSTRERLFLTYVARDQLTGEAVAPSPVVADLLDLCQDHLGAGEAATLVVEHPLRRHDQRPPVIASAEAAREARLRQAGRRLREQLGRPCGSLDLDELSHLLAPDTWGWLADELALPRLPEQPAGGLDVGRPLSISLRALERFLECPLSGWARFNFRLAAEDDFDPLAQEDEPFELSALDRAVLLREVLEVALQRQPHGDAELDAALEAAYDERAHVLELRGDHPIGVFGAVERSRHLTILGSWAEQLQALARMEGRSHARIRSLRFGRAEEHARVGEVLDPLVLEVPLLAGGGAAGAAAPALRVELYGQTQLLLDDHRSVALVAQAPLRPGLWAEKKTLRGFLSHVVLAASGRAHDTHHTHVVYGAGAPSAPPGAATRAGHHRAFAALSPDQARRYLVELVSELVQKDHAYFLPCEVMFLLQQGKKSLPECIEQARADRKKQRFNLDPVPDLADYPAPPEEEIDAIVERRFGPFLRRGAG
jgi:exodeoxyribonuclease V gamma subunit